MSSKQKMPPARDGLSGLSRYDNTPYGSLTAHAPEELSLPKLTQPPQNKISQPTLCPYHKNAAETLSRFAPSTQLPIPTPSNRNLNSEHTTHPVPLGWHTMQQLLHYYMLQPLLGQQHQTPPVQAQGPMLPLAAPRHPSGFALTHCTMQSESAAAHTAASLPKDRCPWCVCWACCV